MYVVNELLYDPLLSPLHNCPARRQFEESFVGDFFDFEKELSSDDTKNDMIVDGQTRHCCFADCFSKPRTRIPYTFVWISNDFFLLLFYKLCWWSDEY